MIRKPGFFVFLSLAALLLGLPALSQGADLPEVMFILDCSGSMWGQAAGKTKIEAAKEVLTQALPQFPPGVKVGLTAYGHRRKGDCSDVEVLIPAGSADRQALLAKVKALKPKGKTPLAASVKMVAESLKTKENETTIVLISDGIETCHDDPCGLVKTLKESGLKFVLHVVGFDVDHKGKAQLACLAQAGGGQFFAVGDSQALLAALEKVKKEVAAKVEEAKTTTVKAKTKLGKLQISMPPSGLKTQKAVNIFRTKDNKLIKEAKPAAEASHPLLAGEYKVVLAFANTNYKPPSPAPLGVFQVKGGQTTEIKLGAIVINLAQGLGNAVWSVRLVDQKSGQEFVRTDAGGNDYYLFKPKPAPAGVYTLTFTFDRSEEPTVVARDIEVEEGQETVVTLDSGLALKRVEGVQGWDLHPAGGQEPLLKVRRRFDNEHPLWERFPVQPGQYDLYVHMKDMSEPLPVAQGLEIKKGQTLVFDTGLRAF